MLIFPLKKEWYEKIRSGEKRIEYREVKPYWEKRLLIAFLNGADWSDKSIRELVDRLLEGDNEYFRMISFYEACEDGLPCNFNCKLRLGYTNRYMIANITKIEIVDGKDTDLHIDDFVYAIYLDDVKEERK